VTILTPPAATCAPAPRIAGAGLLTGWGEGKSAVPSTLAPADAAPALLTVPTPVLDGDRFRRATRECLLAVAAVRAAVADAGLDRAELAGSRTGILYASATAYAAANRAFLEDEGSTTLHFPYTAPSAVPGEVTIEFGIRGPYVNLMGGAPAALSGLWYAARWLADGLADRVLVLAVETMHEVRDLLGPVRRLYRRPLVEGAACLLLEPGAGGELRWATAALAGGRADAAVTSVLDAVLGDAVPRVVGGCAGSHAAARAERVALDRRGGAPAVVSAPGEPFGCAPLLALASARARGGESILLTGSWRNEYAAVWWPATT
jgi:Beta-ketoacyl synthase, N-terminal domain